MAASRRFIAGDPLRACAALGVLVFHAANWAAGQAGFADRLAADAVAGHSAAFGTVAGSLIAGCWLGFLVFFVLSGYLVGGPYARAVVERGLRQSLVGYLRNRVLRIVPAYWLVLTAVIVVFVGLTGDAQPSTGDVAAAYLFHVTLDNPLVAWIGQAWSLGVEVEFYALVAIAAVAVAPAVSRLPGARMRAAAIAIPCMAYFAAAPLLYGLGAVERRFIAFLGLLLAGVAIAAVEPFVRPLVAGSAAWGRAGALLATAGATYCFASGLGTTVSGFFASTAGVLAAHTAVVAVVAGPLLTQWATGGCWRLLDNGALRWLGKRSYSFYLVHLAVLWWLARELAARGLGYKEVLVTLVPLGIALSAALAVVLYRFVERPFLDRKVRRPSPGVSVGPAAAVEARASATR